MTDKDQSYEDAFDMDQPAGASEKAGFGIDPRTQDESDMAAAFDEPKGNEVEALAEAVASDAASAKPDFKSFGEAFKWHRKNGDKVFEWKGKSFNTQLRSEVKPKVKAKPASKAGAEKVAKLDLPAIKDPVKVPDQAPGFEFLFDEATKPARSKALKPAEEAAKREVGVSASAQPAPKKPSASGSGYSATTMADRARNPGFSIGASEHKAK